MRNLPFLTSQVFYTQETNIAAVTSLYFLCCILRIVKIKDLANTVAAALFCHIESFTPSFEAKINGSTSGPAFAHEIPETSNGNLDLEFDSGSFQVTIPSLNGSSEIQLEDVFLHDCKVSHLAIR